MTEKMKRDWTLSELREMDYYRNQNMSFREISLLLNRTEKGCRSASCKHLKSRKAKYTEQERELIEKLFKECKNISQIAFTLNRTERGVQWYLKKTYGTSNYSHYNDRFSKNYNKWSKSDEDYLIENYHILGALEISRKLKKTLKAVYTKVWELRKIGKTIKTKECKDRNKEFVNEMYVLKNKTGGLKWKEK